MAPKSKDAASAPTITTHHSMAAGGQPSAAHETETTAGEPEVVVLTRPKKLVLQPMHTADEVSETTQTEQVSDEDAPLVLETAAETEAASKLAAKLPEGKIELPLEEIELEEVVDNEPADQSEVAQAPDNPTKESDTTNKVTDSGEAAGATAEVDPNEARAQKAELLMASGKYAVHIHESSRSRAGLIVAIIAGAALLAGAVYYAVAEGMLDIGIDLPKFW